MVAVAATHQCPTAQQDHEDNEGLEPAVLHNLKASLPQCPPHLTKPLCRVDVAALEVTDAHCKEFYRES